MKIPVQALKGQNSAEASPWRRRRGVAHPKERHEDRRREHRKSRKSDSQTVDKPQQSPEGRKLGNPPADAPRRSSRGQGIGSISTDEPPEFSRGRMSGSHAGDDLQPNSTGRELANHPGENPLLSLRGGKSEIKPGAGEKQGSPKRARGGRGRSGHRHKRAPGEDSAGDGPGAEEIMREAGRKTWGSGTTGRSRSQ